MERHRTAAQHAIQASIAPSTQRRYRDSWPLWCAFIDLSFPDSLQKPYIPSALPESSLVNLLLAFTSFLRIDKNLTGTGISVLLSGLRFAFRTHLFSSPGLNAPILHQVCRTFTHADSQQTPNTRHRQGARTPFTTSMVLSMSAYADRHTHPRHRMRAVGALLGYFCALRASEYCVCHGSDHTLRAEAVEFEYHGELWSSLYVSRMDFHRVTAVRITIHSAKNIKPGSSQAVWFSASNTDTARFPFVEHLFRWARFARLSPNDYFLSYRTPSGSRTSLQYYEMNSALKTVARTAGVDPAGCGTHSLRRGAATTLSAGGASAAEIMSAGRWRHLPTAAAYQDRTSRSNDHQLDLLQSTTSVTTRDVRMGRCLPHHPRRTSKGPQQ